jgi:hypothetical protein
MPMKRRPKRNPAVPLFRKALNATDANQILRINQFSVMNYEDFPHHLERSPSKDHRDQNHLISRRNEFQTNAKEQIKMSKQYKEEKMFGRLAILLLMFTGLCSAEIVFQGGGVIPQLVDGNGWKTIITLVNLDDSSCSYTVFFNDDNGSALSLTTTLGTGSKFSGTLPARGSTVIETAGLNAGLSQGWAYVNTAATNIIGGTAVFRRVALGQPDYEASEPIDTVINNRFAFPFDHITDATGVALVNLFGSGAATISITFRDEGGITFLTDSFQVPEGGHVAYTFTTRYPQTVGRRGTFEISSSSVWVSVLGLRFSPSGAFSSVTPLVSISWIIPSSSAAYKKTIPLR